MERIIKQIRARWPKVKILVRGDSAYAREDIMAWCESEVEIDYVFGLAQNSRLLQLTQSTQYRASQEYLQKLQPIASFLETLLTPSEELKKQAAALVKNSVWYCSFDYQTIDSWSRSRRVVSKIEYSSEEVKTRFIVTSLDTKKVPPGRLYTEKYVHGTGTKNDEKIFFHRDIIYPPKKNFFENFRRITPKTYRNYVRFSRS